MKSLRIPLIGFTLFLISLFSAAPAMSQSIKAVRINEIQVHNSNGFRDEYGQANNWIELHNTGYGKVDMGGCLLKVNGKQFQIPKGNPATTIPAQGYLVFHADGMPNRGPFHTNFTLDGTDFIKLYDTDGKLIHTFEFNPADMVENVSFGYFDGKAKPILLPATTPGSNNNTGERIHRSEYFRQADPSGIILTIINITVVAIALTLLFFVFKYMGNYHMKVAGRKQVPDNPENGLVINRKDGGVVTNDELAAIAIALYKHIEDQHDNERMVLTMNSVSKAYSPWSSKIYTLRQTPNKK